jgi:hypothetical protein
MYWRRTVISNMLSQYNAWYNTNSPLDQMTGVTEAQTLQQQSAWAAAEAGTGIAASETNGTVTVTNSGAAVNVPITVPAGTTVNGAAFGTAYGGTLSAWVNLGTGATETLTEAVAPTITSASAATSNVGAAFSFTVTTTGTPAPALTESGALPTGLTFKDNGNGTATMSGTLGMVRVAAVPWPAPSLTAESCLSSRRNPSAFTGRPLCGNPESGLPHLRIALVSIR